MCRILVFVLMFCFVLSVPVQSAPNPTPNEKALGNASDKARFNRDDEDFNQSKRDNLLDDDDAMKGKNGKREKMPDENDEEMKEMKVKDKGDKESKDKGIKKSEVKGSKKNKK